MAGLAISAALIFTGCPTGGGGGSETYTTTQGIAVTFSGFGDEDIDLTPGTENDLHVGDMLTVTINGGFDDLCYWSLNGGNLTESSAKTISIVISDNLPIGDHTLTVAVTKNSIPYSKELIFRVVRQEAA